MVVAQSGRGRLDYDYGGDGSGIYIVLLLIIVYIGWVAIRKVCIFLREHKARRRTLLRSAFLGTLVIGALLAAKPFFQHRISQNQFQRLLESEYKSERKELQTEGRQASDKSVIDLCQARIEDARVWVSRAHKLTTQSEGHHIKEDGYSVDISLHEADRAAQAAIAQAERFCRGDAEAEKSVDKLQAELDSHGQ